MANDIANELQGTLAPAEVEKKGPDPIASFDGWIRIGGHDVGITFDVYGEKRRAFPGSRETPPEPSYIDVYRILANDHDVTDWLNDDKFAKAFYDEIYQR